MSLALDGTLQTRLDGIEREPIAKLITTAFASPIPFNGNILGFDEANLYLDLQIRSTGELTLSSDMATTGYTRLMKTDVDRTFWTQWDLYVGESYSIWGQCHCNMPDGSWLVFYIRGLGLGYYLRSIIVPEDPDDYVSDIKTVSIHSNYDVIYHMSAIYHSNTSQYQLYKTWIDYSSGQYHLSKHTSANGESWSGVTNIDPLGTANKYLNVHAHDLSDDDILLTFDYVTAVESVSGFQTTDCYYMISQDDGASWSSPTLVTSYSGVGIGGRHPTVAEKSSNVYYCFHEKASFVIFDENTSGLLTDGSGAWVDQIHYYNGKAYCSGVQAAAGTKNIQGMWVLDPSDMSIEKQYTSTTTPGYDSNLLNFHSWYHHSKSAGKYICRKFEGYGYISFGVANFGMVVVAEYDGVIDKTTHYIIGSGYDNATYGWDENIAVTPAGGSLDDQVGDFSLRFAWIDAANDRLYMWIYDGYLYSNWAALGWVDLTEAPDPVTGYYTWNEIWRNNSDAMNASYGTTGSYSLQFTNGVYCKEEHVVVLWRTENNEGTVMVIDAETGIVQLFKQYHSDQNFPYAGLHSAYVYDNKIYGGFNYTTSGGQSAWKGLWIYDMVSGSKTLSQPGYITQDQYVFSDFDFADIGNNYIWIASNDGAVRFHTGSLNFEIWSQENQNIIPGFRMEMANDYCQHIMLNTANDNVYVTFAYGVSSWAGVRRFNINGAYYKGKYATGIKTGTDLALGSINDLTLGYFEGSMTAVADSDDVMWAFWEHIDYSEDDQDAYWDNDVSEVDVSENLVDTIRISHAIDTPSEVVFNLSYGHLYDQQNTLSSWSYMFRRGRKVTVYLGENINDTPYWVQQGEYIVEEAKMRYVRPDYPILEVTARTMDSLWRDARIALTSYYDGSMPDIILEDIITDWTILGGAEYDIPSPMQDEHEIWHQWTDESIYDIVKDILDHFGYIMFFSNEGVFTPTPLNFTKAVDHAYGDQTHVQEYTPDNTFSNFVNQIRVIGETHDMIEVLYDPELITNVSGTCGWWNETITKEVWYNEERTRTCRNPYLNAIISTKDFSYFIFKGGGGEEITDIDNNELWVEVTIEGPNLIPVVVGLAATAIAVGTAAILCELNCGPFIFATNTTISLLCYAVLATATYDVEVWAQPVGEEKQTIQYISQDIDLLNLINQQPVIEEIEDALCYTVGDCQRVAEFEMNVIKHQRERVRLSKLGHLQDELLDMITVKHPLTNATMQLLIASLTRTLTIKGSMMDSIEGWRIT
jgi:hypothetical protein